MANKAADLVCRNGLIVTPGGTIEGGVAILDGKIAAVGTDGFLPAADRQIDLAGKYLLPGAIDPECHLGSHRRLADDFQTETRAAAATGVTTWGMQLVSLAITGGADKVKGPTDIPSFTKAMPLYYEAARSAAIDFFLTPILGTDEHVGEIPYLAKEHGITSFKLHLQMQGPWKSSWPAYAFDDGSIYATFESVAKLGAPAIALLHCENWEIARVLQQRLVDAGRTDMGAWDDRSPAFTEAGHARTYLYYARVAGCPIYVVHVTTKETIAEIERAKAEGLTVHSEIGTHYLVLHKDAWKINVPLRDRSTHEALWQALASGAIDCIGSDHDSYLLNLGSPDSALRKRSVAAFVDELERCEILGVSNLVAHPGSHVGAGEDEGIKTIALSLDEVHKACPGYNVKVTLEITAGQGSNLGYRFEQIARMLDATKESDRLRVCFDTEHEICLRRAVQVCSKKFFGDNHFSLVLSL